MSVVRWHSFLQVPSNYLVRIPQFDVRVRFPQQTNFLGVAQLLNRIMLVLQKRYAFILCGGARSVRGCRYGKAGRVAREHRVIKCRRGCAVDLHIAGMCKWLQVLIPARLVVRHVVLDLMHSLILESLSLPFRLPMPGCNRIVFGAYCLAYGVE